MLVIIELRSILHVNHTLACFVLLHDLIVLISRVNDALGQDTQLIELIIHCLRLGLCFNDALFIYVYFLCQLLLLLFVLHIDNFVVHLFHVLFQLL